MAYEMFDLVGTYGMHGRISCFQLDEALGDVRAIDVKWHGLFLQTILPKHCRHSIEALIERQ